MRDIEHDRRHPTKRFRPIARGELSPPAALAGAARLAVGGIAVAGLLGTTSVALLAIFAAASSRLLPRAQTNRRGATCSRSQGCSCSRAAAGAAAVGVRISPWLLSCTALLALFLALCKRRAELVLVANKLTPGRPVLTGYSREVLEPLALLTAISAAARYAVYAFVGPDSPEMAATIPFVWFGVGRYLYLVQRRDLGEEPEQVLLIDRLILGAVGLFALTAMAVLAAF